MLYLALGFLEWSEEGETQQVRHAPLLTIPVGIERQRSSEGGPVKNCLYYTGEDNESLGVATMNFPQCELLDELLDHEFQRDAVAQSYLEKWEREKEPFFVKNLENVQGDERDVILISMTYGRDARGNFYQRFGPINSPKGHRRLNVLFTRARKRTVVFSSMDPSWIHVDPGPELRRYRARAGALPSRLEPADRRDGQRQVAGGGRPVAAVRGPGFR